MVFSDQKPSVELNPRQRVDWLRLIRTENVGPATFRKLINRFGSVGAALDALPHLSRKGGRTAPLKAPTITAIEDEIAAVEKMGGRIIAMGEAGFPDLLQYISGAPPMLTIKGGENLNWNRTVGIVGARNASAAGQRLTKLVSGDLGDAGYIIVSGLARGVDAAAHSATLATGTVAVLAGGLDHLYPSENIPLSESIVEQGGALITEMPLGWQPRSRDFPRRNRLVSGISLGVVVVEAAKRSGSLITARFALEQNREVFAIPGSPLDPRSEGANSLIQQGATLATNANDIIDSLSTADPARTMLFEHEADGPHYDAEFDYGDAEQEPSDDERSRLISALSITPVAVDELIQLTQLSVGAVQTILLEFDIAGRIEWASGQLVSFKE